MPRIRRYHHQEINGCFDIQSCELKLSVSLRKWKFFDEEERKLLRSAKRPLKIRLEDLTLVSSINGDCLPLRIESE